jgi:hypothetical protein
MRANSSIQRGSLDIHPNCSNIGQQRRTPQIEVDGA